MSLHECLARLGGLSTIPSLAVELGFAPAWHEIDPATIGLDPTVDAAIVGRQPRFNALGLAVGPGASGRLARSLASSLALRGALALILAVDDRERLLSISVTTIDPPVLTFGLDRPNPVAIRILERGSRSEKPTALARVWHWAEVLAGQSVGEQFFRAFRQSLDQGIALLPPTVHKRVRHRRSLLNLTRILFLYFLQDRGWLDERPDFLRDELERCVRSGGRIGQRFLKPLFFGTLNRPVDRRGAVAARFGRIPFLNGGLFEAHPFERDRLELPDFYWTETFETLFERYHFTVAERSPNGEAIGPDMLGRVFERVMDPDERHASGAFYTPAALVDQLVRAVLERALESAAGPGARGERRAPLEQIRNLKILDPAVGSGAFLVGALKRLVDIRVGLGDERAAATRDVITNCLFGVDLNPASVQLTELRLWLALIHATPDCPIEKVAPLPNLDVLIRQGDSILERFDLPIALAGSDAQTLASLRTQVVGRQGAEKKQAIAALRRAELRAAKAATAAAIETVHHKISSLLTAQRSPDLFGERHKPSKETQRALATLRRDRARLRAMDRQLREANEVPWFSYSAHFSEVLQRGGFDIVIGNPPWVRGETLPAVQREALKNRYRWFRAPGRVGFAPTPDLSVAFLERAFELCRPGGIVAQLLPAKLLTTGYGTAARDGLAHTATLRVVAKLGNTTHGFDATVYPMALVAERLVPEPDSVVRLGFSPAASAVPQSALGAEPWALGDEVEERLAKAVVSFPLLRDEVRCRLGVKTGADSIFLLTSGAASTLARPAIRGRDIKPFLAESRRMIVWTHDDGGRPMERLPPDAARHFEPHHRALERRADYRDGPPWMVFRVEGAIGRHRIVWSDLGKRLEAVALDDPKLVPLNTCYLAVLPNGNAALALAAWLNSGWIRRLAIRGATPAASGYYRFDAQTVGRLPLPREVLADNRLIALSKAAHRGAIDPAAIDERVAELLGLDPALRRAFEMMDEG